MSRRLVTYFVSQAVFVALVSLGCCNDDAWWNDGNPRVNREGWLSAEHEGWRGDHCGTSECHDVTGQHRGAFTLIQCVDCHGVNGATVMGTEHPGFGLEACRGCHNESTTHLGLFRQGECARCHGGNGSPTLDATHEGWQQTECTSCHALPATHTRYEVSDCAPCHGSNGAPPRPVEHWVLRCNDCHADGPAPWNASSHRSLVQFPAQACAGCHPARLGH